MDAHPDMVIAHEFMLFKKWQGQQALKSKANLFNALYRRSLLDATEGWRTMNKDSKGYTLQMEQSWQGRFRKLKVIGDKSGGMVGRLYTKNPEDVQRSYWEIADTVKIPVQVLHVVRDMIATQLLYKVSSKGRQIKVTASVDHPYNDTEKLYSVVEKTFECINAVNRILQEWGLDVLEIQCRSHQGSQRYIPYSRSVISFDVECSEDYLQQCYDKTFKTLSRSRDLESGDSKDGRGRLKGVPLPQDY